VPLPNLSPQIVEALGRRYGRELDPEEILSYVYAVLQAPLYRSRYAALLAHGFPRISFPGSLKAFEALAIPGRELIRLHLFLGARTDRGYFPLAGDPTLPVTECTYTTEKAIVLNPRGLWLERIPPEVWEFRVCGYAVLSHWLRARRGRALQPRDLQEISALVQALGLTVQTQTALDPLLRSVVAEDLSGAAVDPE
jgi:hypothetical protein